jgi:hypothetical protein
MSLPTVTPLPTPPSRQDPSQVFVPEADNFLGALGNFAIELNALAEGIVIANSAANYNSTSTTSLAIGTGSKSLTVESGKLFQVGQFVILSSLSGPSNYMSGQVTAYNVATGAMTVSVTVTGGSGTKNDWTVALSGPQGATGATGGAGTWLDKSGDTMTGPLGTAPSVAGGAGFNVPPGTAPTAPANGDIWTTAAALLVRINGVTQDVLFKSGGTMTGDLALTSGTTVKDAGGTAHKVGYRGVPQNPQNGNYTLALKDAGGHVYSANTGSQTITVPDNATVAFAVEDVVTIVNDGTTAISIVPAAGVTLKQAGTANTGARTLAPNGLISVLKVGTDRWFIGAGGLT